MSDKVVSLASAKKGDPTVSLYLRELADKVDQGDVTELIVIANMRDDGRMVYETFGDWEDRWRCFGAIENAKCKLFGTD